MSFLSSDAMASLASRLEAGEVQEPANIVPQTQPEPSAPVEVKTDAKGVPDTSTADTNDEGHNIPYKRFKSVVETKNELKSKNNELSRQLEELKAQLEAKSAAPQKAVVPEDDDLEDLFRQLDAPDDDRYKSLESRLRSFEEKQAQAELESELASVSRQYPSVPEAVLLQAVVNDPTVDMRTVAMQYDAWISEIQQAAIAEHLKGAVPAKPSAPRRPTASGGNGPTPTAQPKTMRDARAAALEYWKSLQGR